MDGDKKFVLATYAVIIGLPLLAVTLAGLAGYGLAQLLK